VTSRIRFAALAGKSKLTRRKASTAGYRFGAIEPAPHSQAGIAGVSATSQLTTFVRRGLRGEEPHRV
jgi:hypothetical protein